MELEEAMLYLIWRQFQPEQYIQMPDSDGGCPLPLALRTMLEYLMDNQHILMTP